MWLVEMMHALRWENGYMKATEKISDEEKQILMTLFTANFFEDIML